MSDRLIGIDSLRGCLFETRPLILLRELIFFLISWDFEALAWLMTKHEFYLIKKYN